MERERRPSLQVYPADWRKDAELQSCSLTARGLWWEMICIMHHCQPYGHLAVNGKPMKAQALARLVGIGEKDCAKLMQELIDAGVPSVNDTGMIFSRRMVRDDVTRDKWRDRQARHRGVTPDVTANVTRSVTGESRRSSSSPSGESSSLRSSDSGSKPCDGSELKPSDPSFITIPTNRLEKEFSVSELRVVDYERSYPAVDVRQELRAMRSWSIDNPTKRKTASGMGRFINAWLAKEQNRGRGNGRADSATPLDNHLAGIASLIQEKRRESEG